MPSQNSFCRLRRSNVNCLKNELLQRSGSGKRRNVGMGKGEMILLVTSRDERQNAVPLCSQGLRCLMEKRFLSLRPSVCEMKAGFLAYLILLAEV